MKRATILGAVVVALFCRSDASVEAGLATGSVARLAGEMVAVGEDGVRQAVVRATNTYSASERTGHASVEVLRAGGRLAEASAQFSAPTAEAALGAVTALVMAVSGGRPSWRGQLQNVRFEGDARAFAEIAEDVITWWDAKADLATEGYRSPRPSLANLGKLQLNVWGTESNGDRFSCVAVLLFDPDDPTIIVGGSLVAPGVSIANVVPVSHLHEFTATVAPGDFALSVQAADVATNAVSLSGAAIAIDVLSDGTVDVRGASFIWAGRVGNFIVEGTGNAKFVMPAS